MPRVVHKPIDPPVALVTTMSAGGAIRPCERVPDVAERVLETIDMFGAVVQRVNHRALKRGHLEPGEKLFETEIVSRARITEELERLDAD